MLPGTDARALSPRLAQRLAAISLFAPELRTDPLTIGTVDLIRAAWYFPSVSWRWVMCSRKTHRMSRVQTRGDPGAGGPPATPGSERPKFGWEMWGGVLLDLREFEGRGGSKAFGDGVRETASSARFLGWSADLPATLCGESRLCATVLGQGSRTPRGARRNERSVGERQTLRNF